MNKFYKENKNNNKIYLNKYKVQNSHYENYNVLPANITYYLNINLMEEYDIYL